MNTLLQDFRYGLRTLAKSPGFTAVAVLTLALGIGTNAAVLSVADTVLLRPYPYEEPERLAVVRMVNAELGTDDTPVAYADFVDLTERNRVFEGLAAVSYGRFNVAGVDSPIRVRGVHVSANLFSLVGTDTLHGRTFLPEEDRPGGERVAVLSERLWRRSFDADPHIVGRPVRIDGEPRTVVGVVSSKSQLPAPNDAEVFLPIALNPAETARDDYRYFVIGRLKSGVPVEKAGTEIAGIARQIAQEHPDLKENWSARVVSLRESRTGEDRPALLIGLASAAFVLLIACVNVANLLLQRGISRQRDLAVRTALGASRYRLMRQLLVEGLLLALTAAAVGFLLAEWLVRLVASMMPPDDLPPYMNNFGIDGRGLVYLIAIAVATVFIFGMMPALRSSRPNLTEAFGGSGTRSVGGVGRQRLRNALLVVEVVLSMILLVVSGLLVQSLFNLFQADPGFETEKTLTAELAPPAAQYGEEFQRSAFYRDVLERVRAMAGIEAVGLGSNLPFGAWNGTSVALEGERAEVQENNPRLGVQRVGGDYFQAIGQPVSAGRVFNVTDGMDSTRVAILNERAARTLWPNVSPLGKRLQLLDFEDEDFWVTVVGVARDVRRRGLEDTTSLDLYLPAEQAGWTDMMLFARASSDPLTLAADLRNVVQSVDRNLPVDNLKTLGQIVDESFTLQRISGVMCGIFAVFALLMASIGMYGTMAYSVSQRTHEIGIRMALGAQRRDVIRLVVRQMLIIAAAGVSIGLIGAFAMTRIMSSLLFGVGAGDLLTFGAVAFLLIGIALLASYLPARKASRVPPIIALRTE